MSYPASTTGTSVAAKVAVDSNSLTLSLTGTTTHQVVATVKDAAGNIVTGVALVLSAVANASGGSSVYTGTITGGGSSAFAGFTFTVAGFVTSANNGTFECSASTATTLTLSNAAGVAETHAGTATFDDSAIFKFVSLNPSVATVSANGVITAVAKGGAVIEVSHPTFGNSEGLASSGWYADKVYSEINVQVNP